MDLVRPRDCAVMRLSVLLVALCGCQGVPYVLHLARGQLSIQGELEPIEEVLAAGRLSEEDQAKLRLIVRARQFAAQTMGLRVGDSYTMFYDASGDPPAWNLSAARRDALVPVTWTFPLVGQVPYLAFFDENYLREVEGRLIEEGYDTLTYELDAYSTLGLFPDPVRSTMLRRGTLSLVETVIHELLHNTIWRPGATNFNESLATFVGRQGTVEFLRQEYGEESGWPQAAAAFYADVDATNAFLMQLYSELQAFYAQPISRQEKITGREAVYQAARKRFVAEVSPTLNHPDSFAYLADLPTNNAWLLSNYRYNLELDTFAQVYAATGQNWPAALAVFQEAANAPGDPFTYLRDWLDRQDSP